MHRNNPVKRILMNRQVGKTVIGGCGYFHGPLFSAAFQADNYIFLQDIIILERFVTGIKQMQPTNGGPLQYIIPERTIIKPIAETARNNGHQLTVIVKQG